MCCTVETWGWVENSKRRLGWGRILQSLEGVFLPFPPSHPSGISKRKLLKVERSGNPVKSFLFRETQEHCLHFFHFSFRELGLFTSYKYTFSWVN